MSGHSKWSKVKHQKATTDVVKAASFTKASRAIMVAVKEGGGITDPNLNFRLRLAVDQARAVNMPKENIDRITEKASGGAVGELEQKTLEGYGPGGVAFLIEVATDNNNRAVSAVKNLLERRGGSLASPGAVMYLFKKAGVIVVSRKGSSPDQMLGYALEAGADDVVEKDDAFEIYCDYHKLMVVRDMLNTRGVSVDNAAVIMQPTTRIPVGESLSGQIHTLVSELNSLDDVQEVYTNESEV